MSTKIEKVGFRLEAKTPGDVQYSSVLESAWFETVVRDDETAEEAFERAKAVVRAQLENAPVREAKLSNGQVVRQVAPELFDPRKREHQRIAEEWFQRHRVPEKSKSFNLSRIEGLPMHEAERWIENDRREAKAKWAFPRR